MDTLYDGFSKVIHELATAGPQKKSQKGFKRELDFLQKQLRAGYRQRRNHILIISK